MATRKTIDTQTALEQEEHTIVLTLEETVRFDAAILGEDGWAPNAKLLSAVEYHNKAAAEGRIKAR